MARQETNPNNGHYSEQTGHQRRGEFNKAKSRAIKDGLPFSRGQMWVARRFMMRDPDSGKRKRS